MPSCVDFPDSNRRLMTIDVPVGYGFGGTMQANLREDVMLVQFMLKTLFERGFKGLALGPTPTVDGVFGMKTHYHLLLFQRSVYQNLPGLSEPQRNHQSDGLLEANGPNDVAQ